MDEKHYLTLSVTESEMLVVEFALRLLKQSDGFTDEAKETADRLGRHIRQRRTGR